MAAASAAHEIVNGATFPDYASFEKVFQEYCEKTGYVFSKDGKTIESANRKINNPTLHFKPKFKYQLITFKCKHFGEYTSKAKGIRKDKMSFKIGCKASLQLRAVRQKDCLEIRHFKAEHSHRVVSGIGKVKAEVSKQATARYHSPSDLLCMVKSIIPPLDYNLHKGQAGRVAIIGGCQEYTGAPYFSAITALKVGADLSHVFCTSGAATVIKSYSPELIVHPVLDSQNAVNSICQWLPKFHSLIIGPGLGRDPAILDTVAKIITKAKEHNLPMVIDADGLFIVTSDPTIIKGYDRVILTPNVAEYSRLFVKVTGYAYTKSDPFSEIQSVCQGLDNVTIVQKGQVDMISDGRNVLVCSEEGSPRRCGGQGDLLSGSMGLFYYWARLRMSQEQSSPLVAQYGPSLTAAYAACRLTRACSRRAFAQHGRTMTASDLLPQLQHSFEDLFS